MTTREPIILAGDVGGTKANLAYYVLRGNKLEAIAVDKKSSRSYSNLHDLIAEFISAHTLKADHVCLSVAGPVVHGKCFATNLPWIIDAEKLADSLKFNHVELINDLEANAHGIYELSPDDLVTINKGEEKSYGNVAVISAGTGLGEAGILWHDKTMIPFASEGGHCDFAPVNEVQTELLSFLFLQDEHVSYERVLSGMGLFNIYRFLRDTGRYEEPDWLAADIKGQDPSPIISQAGMAKTSELCVEALNIFTDIYGAEAGNLALKLMATGGVYIGGGIAPKMIDKLREPRFIKAFLEKGRLRPVLEKIPIHVVMNDRTALIGAARKALLSSGMRAETHIA